MLENVKLELLPVSSAIASFGSNALAKPLILSITFQSSVESVLLITIKSGLNPVVTDGPVLLPFPV